MIATWRQEGDPALAGCFANLSVVIPEAAKAAVRNP
jgi:hypothetical protein